MAEVKETKKATTAKKTTTPKATTAKKATTTTKKTPAKAEVKVEAKKKSVPMLKIKLVKSSNGRLAKQKKTLEALGLKKLNSETVKPDNAQIRGMIFVVKHLVTVESVKEN